MLHENALHLNFVKLDRIYIYNADTGALTGINRAQNIKGFCLRIFDKEPGTTVEGQTWENVLVNWISYIGNKYTQLGDLKLSVDKDNLYVENPELLSASLVSLLHNLRHINSYAVNVIPLPQLVFDTMNANGAQLNHLMIPLKFDDPIEESFNTVMAASSTSTFPS